MSWYAPVALGASEPSPGALSVFADLSGPLVQASASRGWAGTSLGGVLSAAPAATDVAGAPAVAVRGTGDQVYLRVDGPTGVWDDWSDAGGVATSAPAVSSAGPGRVDVVVRGQDGALWDRSEVAGRWSPWASLGGRVLAGTAPALAATGPGALVAVVVGADGGLYYRTSGAGGWSGWRSLAGTATSSPSMAAYAAGSVALAVRGVRDGLWYRTFSAGRWSPSWAGLGGAAISAPAVTGSGGRLDVVVVGTDQRVYDHAGGVWTRLPMTAPKVATPPPPRPVRPAGPTRAEIAVHWAEAELGKPYSYGAAGPDAFDCSGLTMFAYAHAGIALPHSAAAQAGYGTPVSLSQLQPGDLVFYYSPISHVAIYVGGGVLIHAPYPGTVVSRIALSSMPGAVGARRL